MASLISLFHRIPLGSPLWTRPSRSLSASDAARRFAFVSVLLPFSFAFFFPFFFFFFFHRPFPLSIHRSQRVTRDLVMMTPAGNVHEGPIHRDQEPIPVCLRSQWPGHHESIILLLFLFVPLAHLWLLLPTKFVSRWLVNANQISTRVPGPRRVFSI